MSSIIEGDVHFAGNVTFASQVNLPAGSVGKAQIAAGAGIEPTKIQQRNRAPWTQGPSDQQPTGKTESIYVVTGATGTLREFKAGLVTPPTGDATVTVDLLKNGTSVLASPIILDSTKGARDLVAAAISTMAVAQGDVLEVSVTTNQGTGTLGKGLFGVLVLDEDPQ